MTNLLRASSGCSTYLAKLPRVLQRDDLALEPTRVGQQSRHRTMMAALLIPLGIYLASRVAQIAVLWTMLPDTGARLMGRLTSWDGQWYLLTARTGYPDHLTVDTQGVTQGSQHAFFPLYPALIRALDTVPSVSENVAALSISYLAGAVAAVCIYKLVTDLYSPRIAGFAVALIFTQPLSIVFSMAYTESLMIAFVSAALLALYRGSWVWAGAWGFLAGLTRPTGAAVAAAMVLTLLWVWWCRRRTELVSSEHSGSHEAVLPRNTPWWKALLGIFLGALSTPLFIVYIGQRVGTWNGWFLVQNAPGWGSQFDGGIGTLKTLHSIMSRTTSFFEVATCVLTIGVIVGMGIAISERVWFPFVASSLCVALIVLMSATDYPHVKPRLLLPALVALIPIGAVLARARLSSALIAMGGFAIIGLWFGAYAITVWTGSP